jgi:hypothetical protein
MAWGAFIFEGGVFVAKALKFCFQFFLGHGAPSLLIS